MAAGRGTRMRSDLPKALHPVCGQPMLGFLINRAEVLGAAPIVVVAGYKIKDVRAFAAGRTEVVEQKKLLGSGHAVNQAADVLSGFDGSALVLYCDTPLVSAETLKKLLDDHRENNTDCSLLSAHFDNPFSYGRVKRRSDGLVEKIVEENDATTEEKALTEINVGCYVFDSKKLFNALKCVRPNPIKKEVYLTDAVGLLADTGKVRAVLSSDTAETQGINTRLDLSRIQCRMQQRILDQWIEKGVEIRDPRTTTIDADVTIGAGTKILPSTVIEAGSWIGKDCSIGPFARIRGGSSVGDGSVIGNFVELVRSKIGKKTQVKHLSYIGDAEVGNSVNIGAGTITANYDGKKKHKTIIRDGAQIGSGTVLVAPVTVGRGAKTGAGAVVTKGKSIPAGKTFVGVPAKEL